MAEDVQTINERRRAEKERRETFLATLSPSMTSKQKNSLTPATPSAYQHQDDGVKELRIIVKTDVSGTTEAVVGAISGIGNKEARVAVVQSGVGDVTDSDIKMASAVNGMILGFNVSLPRSMEMLASQSGVPVHIDTVIYRLIDEIRTRVAALLPPTIEHRVLGEAKVQELFNISLRGGKSLSVAGCRIINGTMEKNKTIRVVRNGEIIARGPCSGLKHHRDEVNEVRKGMECGLTMEDFTDFKAGDLIQSFSTIEVPRTL
ncbi:hypothetical protein FRC02_009508 [Tulasnella sp. 418]|nr:hypothetical protein FRC02_009508 [Tulasnella sp. 418]